MKISVITPHYNDFEGLKQTYKCLKNQNSEQWEWIIIDDFSNSEVKKAVQDYFHEKNNKNITLLFNETKTNASICRNKGIEFASHSTLVFLDSDDIISEDFVANRLIKVEDFVVFRNTNVLNEKGENIPASNVTSNYLDHFLKANFVWPITAILWNKSFLISIGNFNTELQRLQDVELSIRALFLGKKYRILDNKIDFFYNVVPIRTRKNFVNKVVHSVNYLINEINANYDLSNHQNNLLKGYYYLCVKYLSRFKNNENIKDVRSSLKLFYTKKYVSLFRFVIGIALLKLYKLSLISDSLFLRFNRYFFK